MEYLSSDLKRRVVAEQVIQNVVFIVKELLENSIDADSTLIKVAIFENFLGGIEIQDNGHGISQADFVKICEQGATSKFTETSDVTSIKTLGFRGMALFAISQLCKIEISTRSQDSEQGSKLELIEGKITKQSKIASNVGTIIKVTEIFYKNPTRGEDLRKRVNFYIRKVTELVNSYALINYSKRISLRHFETKEKTQAIVAPLPCLSIKDRLALMFGRAFVDNFKEFSSENENFKMFMLVESPYCEPKHKVQYFFLNKRIVDLPKNLKNIMNASFIDFPRIPGYVLLLSMDNGYDINASNDKMTAFFDSEAKVAEAFSDFIKKVSMEIAEGVTLGPAKSQAQDMKRKAETITQPTKLLKSAPKAAIPIPVNFSQNKPIPSTESKALISIEPIASSSMRPTQISCDSSIIPDRKNPKDFNLLTQNALNSIEPISCISTKPQLISYDSSIIPAPQSPKNSHLPGRSFHIPLVKSNQAFSAPPKLNPPPDPIPPPLPYAVSTLPSSLPSKISTQCLTQTSISSRPQLHWNLKSITPHYFPSSPESAISSDRTAPELSLSFSKSDISGLALIGQFNHGFILAQKDSKIFIIDQHAADEKFLFETLQQTTEIHKQPLIIPKRLDLTSEEENLLKIYVEAVQMNGFTLSFDDKKPIGSKIMVCSFPFTKNIVFDLSDFREMLENLKKISCVDDVFVVAKLIRPSKFRSLFASRACRQAVMIGTALDPRKMNEIIQNLTGLYQPWNCPHGRPTLRLLRSVPAHPNTLSPPKFNIIKSNY